jgi:hypothetical protein
MSFFPELRDPQIGGGDFLFEAGHFLGIIELLPGAGELLLELPHFLVLDVELLFLFFIERHGSSGTGQESPAGRTSHRAGRQRYDSDERQNDEKERRKK